MTSGGVRCEVFAYGVIGISPEAELPSTRGVLRMSRVCVKRKLCFSRKSTETLLKEKGSFDTAQPQSRLTETMKYQHLGKQN